MYYRDLTYHQLYGESCQSGGYFAIWLKAEKFSVVDRNVIPTGSKLISAFCIILWGFLSDYTGSRFALIICPLVRHEPKYWEPLCAMIKSDILAAAGLDPKRHLGFLATKRAAEVICFPDEQCASHDGGIVSLCPGHRAILHSRPIPGLTSHSSATLGRMKYAPATMRSALWSSVV